MDADTIPFGPSAITTNRMDYQGFSTRPITSSVDLLTGCFHMRMFGRNFHTHASAYLIRGRNASLLIDTGHAKDGPAIEAFIRSRVGEDLTYIFPTHEEYPHAGNLDALLTAFPKAKAVGEVRNYHLYLPEHDRAGRFVPVPAWQAIDLGDRTVTVLPGLIHDLPATSWAYDDKDGLLFVSDAFAFSHYHSDECALFTEELPFRPALEDTRMVLEIALYWTRFSDSRGLIADVHRMLEAYPTRKICPAHGNVVTNPRELSALMDAAFLANGIEKSRRPAPGGAE